MVPAPHEGVVVQQGSPGPPQLKQVPPVVLVVEHFVPGALQTLPQQLCPSEPHPVQRPSEQVPEVLPHMLPDARQVPE
jgi:hypothetical protein